MRFARFAALLMVVVLAAACSSESVPDDEVGDCKIEAGAVCKDQDLRNISFVAANLQGIDLSGSDLALADFRDADLTGAKFVGSLLGGVNFAGAKLNGADLTDAFMFGTNLTGADMEGAVETGVQRCQVTEPDGSYTPGEVLNAEGEASPCSGATELNPAAPAAANQGALTEAPSIRYFRAAAPERCINDVAGTGIDVQWSVQNATTSTFFVDGIRIQTTTKNRGTARLPFVCNGEPHIVGMQSFGPVTPAASASFTSSLENTAPLSNED